MAWSQQQFAQNQNEMQPLINSETQAAQNQNQEAQASYNRYTNTEVPLQNQYLAEAEQYNNPTYAQTQAGAAISSTDAAYTGARANTRQQLQTYGADPGTARATAANAEMGSQEAAAKAAAGTASTQNTRMTGLNLQANAENMMAGLPGQSTAEYGGANSAGSTASGNALGLTNSGASTMGTAAQWNGMSSNSLNNWGNTLSAGYNAEMSREQYDASVTEAQSSEYGQIFGDITGMLAKGGVVPGYASGGSTSGKYLALFGIGNDGGTSGGSKSSPPPQHPVTGTGYTPTAPAQVINPGGTLVGNAINDAYGGPSIVGNAINQTHGKGGSGSILGNGINDAYGGDTIVGDAINDRAMAGGNPGDYQAAGPAVQVQPGVIPMIPSSGSGYAHGGMAIPDNLSYAKGGPIMPKGVGSIAAPDIHPGMMKVYTPHLMVNSHPHTASHGHFSVGAGGSPRASAALSLRPPGGGHAMSPAGFSVDSKSGGLPGPGSAAGVLPAGAAGAASFAEGGLIPSSVTDPYGRADNIRIKTRPGSYVVPKSVVSKLGSHFFYKIIAQHGGTADKQAAELHMKGLHDGLPRPGQGAVPVDVSGGEMVIPEGVVARLGTHFFDKIVAREGDPTDRQAAEARLAGQQSGPGNGPAIPKNQLAAIAPMARAGVIPVGATP